MPRKPIEDIVPGRSIRNIPLPETRVRASKAKSQPKAQAKIEPKQDVDVDVHAHTPDTETLRSVREEFVAHSAHNVAHSTPHESARNEDYFKRNSGGGKKKLIISGIVLAVIALALIVSNVFHAATITVTPKMADASLDENLTAYKSSSATSSSVSSLTFNSLVVNEIGSAKVAAAGEEKVNRAASGTIIIYNNYNATAQRLVKNTRFETPEGLIFRITDSVTVPGKKGTVPGSVEATIVADATGEKYNVGLKDFTIPGFKGDPRFNTFYARSKTPLQGGFVGTVKVVVDADRLKAQTDIKTKATVNLLQQLSAKKNSEQVFFDNAYTVECTPLPQETLSDKEVLIKMDCALSAALFDIKGLSAYLAGAKRITGFKSGDSIAIDNLSEITFKPKTPFNPGSSESISFGLAGKAKFVWLYDVAALKKAFIGKTKSDAQNIIQSFPMIQKVDVSIRPAWRRAFPTDVADITILTDLSI